MYKPYQYAFAILGIRLYIKGNSLGNKPTYYVESPTESKTCLTYDCQLAKVFSREELDNIYCTVKETVDQRVDTFKYLSEKVRRKVIPKDGYEIIEPDTMETKISRIILCTAVDLAVDMGIVDLKDYNFYDKIHDLIKANNYFMYEPDVSIIKFGDELVALLVDDKSMFKRICELPEKFVY